MGHWPASRAEQRRTVTSTHPAKSNTRRISFRIAGDTLDRLLWNLGFVLFCLRGLKTHLMVNIFQLVFHRLIFLVLIEFVVRLGGTPLLAIKSA
jgi:hypothetical protein